ncbi:UNVERIFIED_CONTAM: hypothetical protein Scaly_1059700 [Sesamum calycinum]|uniref:Uncharacterized protein n=1 Tax=Sesamum calycinum TaxID=2727403 RepID=A0AAW2QM65_9LAMI
MKSPTFFYKWSVRDRSYTCVNLGERSVYTICTAIRQKLQQASVLAITPANTSTVDRAKSESAKDIWTTFETRYGGDDAGRKKYVVVNGFNFQMIDEKPIMDQIHKYENLVADVLSEGMKMCEILQANVLLEKFTPTWCEYRNHLKHEKKDLTLQELIGHMRTEETNRLKDKETSLSSLYVKAILLNLLDLKTGFTKTKEKNPKE